MRDSIFAAPISTAQIEKIAHVIRLKCGLENKLYFPIEAFIEVILPEIYPGFSYDYVSPNEMAFGTYAYFNPYENIMSIREDVYIRACQGEGRDRFTLAHESGHCILNRADMILCRNDVNRTPKPYENPEWQANEFASAILMPRDLIRKFKLTPQEISTRCKTSITASKIAYEKSQAHK